MWMKLVLLALATYRGALLVTRDTVPLGHLRTWLDRRFTGDLLELIHCVWCTSMYIGAAFLVLTIYEWPVWHYFEWVFAASAIAGFLGEHS